MTSRTFTEVDARTALPIRSAGSHKWSVGAAMIFAGSPGYLGAPALAANAAARSGAGIVHLAVNRNLVNSLAILSPETVFIPLRDGDVGQGSQLFEAIGERADRCNSFLLGPGLGDDDYARDLVSMLLGLRGADPLRSLGFGASQQGNSDGERRSLVARGKPIVVDADGLNALSTRDSWWERVPAGRLVLTPHVGELARLTGQSTDEISANPTAAAMAAAKLFGQVVLLKGAPSLVTDGTDLWTAADAPLSLATAGTGDVLSGSLVALLCQGLDAVTAANLALYLGAKAARMIEAEYGVNGLVAGDLPVAIARAAAELAKA